MAKIIVHEFDPIVYPLKLWVIKKPTKSVIDEWFEENNGKPLNSNFDDIATATTYNRIVTNKKTLKYGILICLHKKITVNTIAHESTHAARLVWDHIGEDVVSNEADAYLVGWIAQCVDEVVKFKNKNL